MQLVLLICLINKRKKKLTWNIGLVVSSTIVLAAIILDEIHPMLYYNSKPEKKENKS